MREKCCVTVRTLIKLTKSKKGKYMSEKTHNAYDIQHTLRTNEGATAAAIEIIRSALNNGGEDNKKLLLNWMGESDILKNLGDKIKESAARK